jgi:hypothetical protein
VARGLIQQVIQAILLPTNEQIQEVIDKKANKESGFNPFND